MEAGQAAESHATARSGEPLWQHLAIAALVIAACCCRSRSCEPFQLVEAPLLRHPLRPSRRRARSSPAHSSSPSTSPHSRRSASAGPGRANFMRSWSRACGRPARRSIGFDIIFAEPSSEEADAAFAEALGPGCHAGRRRRRRRSSIRASRSPGSRPSTCFSMPAPWPASTSVDARRRRRLADACRTRPDSFAAEVLRTGGHRRSQPPPAECADPVFRPAAHLPDGVVLPGARPGRISCRRAASRIAIVLVGLSLKAAATADSGAADAFPTPYTLTSESLTAGVEVQATILDNLLHRLYVVPVPRIADGVPRRRRRPCSPPLLCRRGVTWQTGLRLRSSLLVGFFARSLAASALRPDLGAACPAGRRGACWCSAPGSASIMRASGGCGGRCRRPSRAISRRISSRSSRATPSSLKLGGERRNLTILFCDVRGFTSLSERLKDEPERLTALINRLLDPLSEAILAEGGTIDKYMGDCVMAFWNAPLPSPDHPRSARCAPAERMLKAVADLNRRAARGGGRRRAGLRGRRRHQHRRLRRRQCGIALALRLFGARRHREPRLAPRGLVQGIRRRRSSSGPTPRRPSATEYVLIELDRIAVRGRATESAIYTVVAPLKESDASVAELMRLQPGLLDAMRAGETRDALDLIEQCRSPRAAAVRLLRQAENQIDRINEIAGAPLPRQLNFDPVSPRGYQATSTSTGVSRSPSRSSTTSTPSSSPLWRTGRTCRPGTGLGSSVISGGDVGLAVALLDGPQQA